MPLRMPCVGSSIAIMPSSRFIKARRHERQRSITCAAVVIRFVVTIHLCSHAEAREADVEQSRVR